MTENDGTGPGACRLALAQATLVSSAFALLLVASNLINPMLPVYRDVLDLSSLVLSLTFVLYVGALVAVLIVLARPRFAQHATTLVLCSLSTLVASDLLLANTEQWSILLGRVLAGIAAGLGTGAASALVVSAIGAAGRSITATGNLVGGVIGVTAGQALVSGVGGAAPQVGFIAHAGVVALLIILLAVVLRARRQANAAALGRESVAAELAPPAPVRLRRRTLALLCTGSIAWIGVSVGVVFSATVFRDLDQPSVEALGPAILLSASAISQLTSPAVTRAAPWISGMLMLAIGAAGICAGALTGAQPIALAGFALLGAGTGFAYRSALVALTRGTSPVEQGALASTYAAATYSTAAACVLAVGRVGDSTGLGPAALGTLATLAVLALACLRWAPRLRDTVER